MNKFETVVKDVVKGVEWPFKHGAALISLIDTGIADEPALKDACKGLVAEFAELGTEGAIVVASKGANLAADMAELVAAKAMFDYLRLTFIPAIEKVWKDIEPAVDSLSADASVSEPADFNPAPGIHTTVAA